LSARVAVSANGLFLACRRPMNLHTRLIPSDKTLPEHILKLLPEDGTPVLNRVMRVMLAREFQHEIDSDLYFRALDKLTAEHRIGRQRGQGGQVFAISAPATTPAPEAPQPVVEDWPEASLMKPLERYLKGPFRDGLDLPKDAISIVHDTSTAGPRTGQWARPDYILVSAMRFKLMPGAQVDLHSFELKTESGGSVQAVHEALAQTRFTHFGHFVWHLPKHSKAEAKLGEIEKHCDEHGIGLILMRDPKKVEDFEIRVDPVRKATPPIAIEGFLESRLTKTDRERLARVVGGG
jgi:hypothetical protein